MPTHKNPEADRFKGPAKYAEYLVARVLVSILQRIPIRLAYHLGRGVGWLAWKTLKRRRATVRKNLEVVNAWMEAQSAELRTSDVEHRTLNKENPQVFRRRSASYGGQDDRQTGLSFSPSNIPLCSMDLGLQTKEVFQRIGANLLSGFTFGRMRPEQAERHIEIEGLEHLKEALDVGKGAIILLAHMGPWEALSQFTGLARMQGIHATLGAMYRPLNNSYLDKWVKAQRGAMGTQLFSRRDGFHQPMSFLCEGGMLGILADQKMREGPKVPYFGVTAPTNPVPGLFQRRTGAPIIAVSVETVGVARWCLSIRPVKWPESVALKDRKTPARHCNAALEQAILRSPLDGFWLHKRF